MAIDFNNREAIGRLNDLFVNPTGWGSGVISALTAAFGASNPFNSAALADTGDAAGQVPVLDSAGVMEDHLKPATAAVAGAVRVSPTRTTRTAASGFPLVMFAAQALAALRAADPNQNLFGTPIIYRGTHPRLPFNLTLPTNAGFVLMVGASDDTRENISQMQISGTTFNNVAAPNITVGNASAAPANRAKRGADIRPLTATERGGVFRFGLYLTGFGQIRNILTTDLVTDVSGQNSDLVVAFKVETPNGMTLRLGGGGGVNIQSSYFILIPAQ